MSSKIYGLLDKLVNRTKSLITSVNGASIDENGSITYKPVNLLDNSDFRNPINQRRELRYGGSFVDSMQGSIDRWSLYRNYAYNTDLNNLVINDGYVHFDHLADSYSCQMIQYDVFSNLNQNTVLTFAVKELNGTVRLVSGRPIDIPTKNGLRIRGVANDDTTVSGDVEILREGDYIWAALYEGEYTVDTLPEYSLKASSYSEEWHNCQRYYRKKKYLYYPCTALSTTELLFTINLGDIPMMNEPIVSVGFESDDYETSYFYYKGTSASFNYFYSSDEVVNYVEGSTILNVKVTLDTAVSGIAKRTGYVKNVTFEISA